MKQAIPFTKMHGAGNDFIVLNNLSGQLPLHASFIQAMANRHMGIGADQVLVVETPDHADHDFKYRIFNADGVEVAQCGNGARCFAQYVFEKNLSAKTELRVETLSGVIVPQRVESGMVRVNMGQPRFNPEALPSRPPCAQTEVRTVGLATEYNLSTVLCTSPSNTNPQVGCAPADSSAQWPMWWGLVSMGNPHAVAFATESQMHALSQLGPVLQSSEVFPESVNVGLMHVHNPHQVHLRVFERGVGETLACGTGACAAAVHGIHCGVLQSPVAVHKQGGVLTIEWDGDPQSPVYLTGPATTVFEGVWTHESSK